MYNDINNAYIANAISDLVRDLGVKDDPCWSDFINLVRQQRPDEAARLVAVQFGLPVLVHVSEERFSSSSIVHVRGDGQPSGAIAAQVFMGDSLPSFGTPELDGFRVSLKLSREYADQPMTLLFVLAHEFAHVLLHSPRHPQRHSEVYTDLTALVLGFRSAAAGRKVVGTSVRGGVEAAQTTTYGYLTDAQFACALDQIDRVLQKGRLGKARVLSNIASIRRVSELLQVGLRCFTEFMAEIDGQRRDRCRSVDAQRIVRLHSPAYKHEIEQLLHHAAIAAQAAECLCASSSHYTNRVMDRLQMEGERTELLVQELRGQRKKWSLTSPFSGATLACSSD